MTFSNFLAEGLIKLPAKLVEDAAEFFMRWFLAYVASVAEHGSFKDEIDRQFFESAIKQLAKKYSMPMPAYADIKRASTSTFVRTKLKLDDLPAAYLSRLAKLHGEAEIDKLEKLDVDFIVTFKPHPLLADNIYGICYEEPNRIVIGLQNSEVKDTVLAMLIGSYDLAELKRRVEHSIGVIEHELTHVIQNVILRRLDPKQASVRGVAGASENDKYLTSIAEFDPWVKLSVRELRGVVERAKATHDKDKWRDTFTKFVWKDVPNEKLEDIKDLTGRSDFMRGLKLHKPVKWKKAIKLLAITYNQLYGDVK